MRTRSILFVLALALFSMAATAANQALLTWNSPTTYADGTPITTPLTYNVYQAPQGQPKVKTATGLTVSTATVATGLLSNRTYCWQVSAQDGATEGALSNEACKTFPPSPPDAPTGLTAQ